MVTGLYLEIENMLKSQKMGQIFYRANDYLNRKDAKNVRFYMNVESKAAPEVFEDVLTLVEEVDKDSVISAKISHPVHAGLYSDNIVLYISATDEDLELSRKKSSIFTKSIDLNLKMELQKGLLNLQLVWGWQIIQVIGFPTV